MKINERIRFLRKEILNFNQEKFANRINISRSNIASIENERIKVTERILADISREFAVNREWLEEGIEPIFKEGEDPFTTEILKLYNQLTDTNRKYLRGYMDRLLEEQKLEE